MGCIVLLAACAASESQLVQEGNWYQIGYQDAVTEVIPSAAIKA